MVHKKLAWASAVKIWNQQNAWADDMYALPKKAGQYYQDIVDIIAEHGGPKPVVPEPVVLPVVAPVDIFSSVSQKFEAPQTKKISSNSKNMEVPMTNAKVRIVSVETVTHVLEFTFDEFRKQMKKDDEYLTDSSITKMWLKLTKKKEHKIKDNTINNDEVELSDSMYLVNKILKLDK